MSTRNLVRMVVVAAVAFVAIALMACGQGSKRVPTPATIGTQQTVAPAAVEQQVTWPAGLPEDQLQPWETMDANGYVIPPKGTSNLNFDSIFAAGIERYLEAGDVTDFGETSSFASGAAGEESVSYAIYRLPMGVEQPGTITADVNLHSGSAYYIGVGDYSVNTWHWHGPFAATHVRFYVPDAEYTSGIGNLMLAVVAYDGASFPVAGGVFAEWIDVAAGDLAGYRIYANGVEVLDYLEGGTSIVVPATEEVEVTLTAVDISGNESEMSDPATETPLAGDMPIVELTATAASGARNDSITLTATGGENYDWDIDGDGVWDFTDDATNTKDADTSNLGVIRPALRARTSDGGFSLSAVSLFITGNFRPVVLATADVTSGPPPLDVNFTIVAEDDDGTIEEYAWDFDGDGTFDDSSSTNPSPLAHNYPDAGMYNAKFRATDNDGAWAVDTVAVQVLADPTNLPPVAILEADETVIYLGETGAASVNFDASASYDPDGGGLEYAFDPLGVGQYTSFSGTTTLNYDYASSGSYQAGLKVKDEAGSVSWASQQMRIYRFGSTTADSAGAVGQVGQYSSLAVVNGNPAISYYDATNTALKYVRASDASGSSWSPPVTLDSTGNVGYDTSLAVVDGFPAISYCDVTNDYLKYVRASDASGSSWSPPVTVDSAGAAVRYTSLAIVNSNPAISYYNGSPNYDLKYVRASDASGGSWGTPVTVDSAEWVGKNTSLAVVRGNPAISYWDNTNYDLKYVRASDASGGSWNTPVAVDSTGTVGDYSSLTVVNGNPAISYHDETNHDLKYVRASDASGESWGAPLTVDSAGFVGTHTSLAVVNGYPAISYFDQANGDLKYVWASDTSGGSWGRPVILDSAGAVGHYTSLAVVNGNPAISYLDFTNTNLKFAYPRLD